MVEHEPVKTEIEVDLNYELIVIRTGSLLMQPRRLLFISAGG